MINPNRLQNLYRIMAENHLDAVAIIPGSNLRYLTGAVHMLMERPLVLLIPQNGTPGAIIPNFEVEQFMSHGFAAQIFAWHDADGYDSAFTDALRALNLQGKRVGVEGQRIRFFEVEALRRADPSLQIIDAHKTISSMRLIKTTEEIAALKQAIHYSEEALRRTLAVVKVGMTEREVANILVANLNAAGGEGVAFEPIVLANDNSARPHGSPRSDYAIQPGDPLLFDFGTTYQGYNADITRTVFVGEPTDHHRTIYEAVRHANAVGRSAVKAGVTADYVDVTTLNALIERGFEALITHKTGHGLGLDVHEDPYIMRGNPQVLESGMVFTVEPGLYESGSLGVRIEDNVVVTPDGADSLTTFPRELMVIG